MAKKTAKTGTKKKTAARSATSGRSKSVAGKKRSPAKKAASKTKSKQKRVASSTKKKATVKKAPVKKAAAKKSAAKKRPAAKKAAKKIVKVSTPKSKASSPKPKASATKKAPAKSVAAKSAGSSKVEKEPKGGKGATAQAGAATSPAASVKAPASKPAEGSANKSGRKGITVVDDKGSKKKKSSAPAVVSRRPEGTQLLGPGSPIRRPLIPSGPSAPPPFDPLKPVGDGKALKSPFNKKDLEKWRAILLDKRRALVGDVSQLESEALRGREGELSKTPQHIAEQGSDSAEQTLSLDLAAADRKLIKEIDDALSRIDEGRFGLCELTGRAIRHERLRELPWARYSIDAARELERRALTGRWQP